MPKIADAVFRGARAEYGFDVYPINTAFKPTGAVYAFTRRSVDAQGKGSHELLYIGQTESLADRVPNHEKLAAVLHRGANCICVHQDGDSKRRFSKETDLRSAFSTPFNDQ